MDLTTKTPVEIDRELSRQLDLLNNAMYRIDRIDQEIKVLDKESAEAPKAERINLCDERQKLTEKTQAIMAEIGPGQEEFNRRGGWNRFYMVEGGHLHLSTSCCSCYSTTQFGWVVDRSGTSYEDIVKVYGEVICTVCIASAPVMKGFGDGTSQLAKLSAAEREQKSDEKAIRAAKKAAAKKKTAQRENVNVIASRILAANKRSMEAAGSVKTWDGNGERIDALRESVSDLDRLNDRYAPQAQAAIEKLIEEHGLGADEILALANKKAKATFHGCKFHKDEESWFSNYKTTWTGQKFQPAGSLGAIYTK